MRLGTLIIGCLILLASVGVIVKLLLDIGSGDTYLYSSAQVARRVRICPSATGLLGKVNSDRAGEGT
jgi:hypothetical protein